MAKLLTHPGSWLDLVIQVINDVQEFKQFGYLMPYVIWPFIPKLLQLIDKCSLV